MTENTTVVEAPAGDVQETATEAAPTATEAADTTKTVEKTEPDEEATRVDPEVVLPINTPLNPKPSDLPPEAEPAMEKVKTEEQAAEAPADDAKTEENKADDGTDEVLEALRVSNETKAPAAFEDTADTADLHLNQIVVGKRADDFDRIRAKYTTADELKQAKYDENSLLMQVLNARDHGWGTMTGQFYYEILKLNDTYKHLVSQISDEMKLLKDGRPKRASHKNAEVSGAEALMAIRSRLGAIVRVNLLNSGFWVALRVPQIAELQEIFSSIDIEGKELGRIIGGHFALCVDMYLKEKFCDILTGRKIIVESNFRDIFKKGAFVRNLAFHDYDTLIHGLVTLMAKSGFRHKLVCPKCGNVSVEENIDVAACKFVNRDLMSDEFHKWWSNRIDENGRAVIRSEEDLAEYRNKILGFHHTITQDVDGVKIELDLAEPVMSKFLRVSSTLIDNLKRTIDEVAKGETSKEEIMRSSLQIHAFELLAPWIKEMRVYDDDGTTVDIRTADSAAIIDYLGQAIQDNENPYEELHKFVSESRINYFGAFNIKCPKCGEEPEKQLDGFYPLEFQTIFFGLLFRRLRAAS